MSKINLIYEKLSETSISLYELNQKYGNYKNVIIQTQAEPVEYYNANIDDYEDAFGEPFISVIYDRELTKEELERNRIKEEKTKDRALKRYNELKLLYGFE